MYIKYMSAFGDNRVWEGDDPKLFDNIIGKPYWRKGIYFYPSVPEEPVWLWMVGHEQAEANRKLLGRMWRTRWVIHFVVKGKGYYNGQLVQKGSSFICWPNLVHSMVPDPDDPFEYYWIMVRGKDVKPFVRRYGYTSDQLIFDCPYAKEVCRLCEVVLHNDYSKTDLDEFNSAMCRLMLSYHKASQRQGLEGVSTSECYVDYVSSAKNLLHDNNYALSVQELSHMLGVTSKHLGRVFLKTIGESPKNYITRKRLELGMEMLQNGMPPSEVAVILKYSDYTSFYRAFRGKYHRNPSSV